MESVEFNRRTKTIYDQIFDAFDDIDPDIAEVDESADNVKISFANGTIFVINRQRPTSQIWVATKKSGYHFNFDAEKDSWVCDKTGADLFQLLSSEISEQMNQPFQF